MKIHPWLRALIGNVAWLLWPRLPWRLAERLVARRIARAKASPERIAQATEQMAFLLSEVALPREIDEAALGHLEFWAYEAELRWHPRRAIDQRVEGIEHVTTALELGRGAVVSFVHHGLLVGMFAAIRRAGVDHVTVVRRGALGWYERPRQRQAYRLFRRGGPLVDVGEGIAGLIERLSEGQTLMIASDVPGSSSVTLGGRRVRCSSGAIRAAQATGAPILAVDAFRSGNSQVVRFSPPLYPEGGGDTQELLERVMAHHEDAILRWPEATFMPTITWPDVES